MKTLKEFMQESVSTADFKAVNDGIDYAEFSLNGGNFVLMMSGGTGDAWDIELTKISRSDKSFLEDAFDDYETEVELRKSGSKYILDVSAADDGMEFTVKSISKVKQ